MNKITIWSDFACPFCYIGERRLQNAIKQLGREDKFEITYKAFELNPEAPKNPISSLPVVERLAKKYHISTEEAQRRIDSINAQGREIGIDFRFDSVKSSNTFDAHRLMKLAEAKYDEEIVEKLNNALFSAYFTKNLSLANNDVLLEIGLEAGLKEEDIMRTLDTNEYNIDVRRDENEASYMGITGVPYIVFNNKYAVPGAVSTDDFKSVLGEVYDKEPIENFSSKAKSCNETGCTI